MADFDEWRAKIDAVDQKLLELLNERAGYTLEIGKLKKVAGLPVYDPEREKRIYRRLAELNAGPLSMEAVRRLFERIIDESRRLEKQHMAEGTRQAKQGRKH